MHYELAVLIPAYEDGCRELDSYIGYLAGEAVLTPRTRKSERSQWVRVTTRSMTEAAEAAAAHISKQAVVATQKARNVAEYASQTASQKTTEVVKAVSTLVRPPTKPIQRPRSSISASTRQYDAMRFPKQRSDWTGRDIVQRCKNDADFLAKCRILDSLSSECNPKQLRKIVHDHGGDLDLQQAGANNEYLRSKVREAIIYTFTEEELLYRVQVLEKGKPLGEKELEQNHGGIYYNREELSDRTLILEQRNKSGIVYNNLK